MRATLRRRVRIPDSSITAAVRLRRGSFMSDTSPCSAMLSRLVERAGALYSLPAVAMKVVELTSNPQVDAAQLKQCIQNDPALTTKILRTVNSSLFGLSRDVSDLNQALALLGTKPLKLLVLGFSLPAELFDGVRAEILAHYWRHALTKAVAARQLSRTLFRSAEDDAFLAGLLQDLGILVLLQDLGEPYAAFLQKVYAVGADPAPLEFDTLGFEHAVLSARLLDHWGLPESLVRVIAVPHDTASVSSLPEADRPLPQILHLAELLAQLLADGRTDALPMLLEAGRAYHELTAEQVSSLVEGLQEQVEHLADVLSLKLPDGIRYHEVLADAHAQLVDVAADAAGKLAAGELGARQARAEAVRQQAQSLAGAVRRFSERITQGRVPVPPQPAATSPTSTSTTSPTPANAAGVATGPLAAVRCGTVDPGLLGRLGLAVAACRRARRPLSLLLAELDDYRELLLARGAAGAANLVARLEKAAAALPESDGSVLPLGDARLGVILEGCDRPQAVEAARRLVGVVDRWSKQHTGASGPAVTVSAGVATVSMPPKNFPAEDLFEAAERCLHAAQSCGGNGSKSIGIY